VVRDIILDNALKLTKRTNKTCEAWGITMEQLLHVQESELNKVLLHKATSRPLNLLNELHQLKSEEELKINQPHPTYETSGVNSAMMATYLETRAGLHWGNKGEQIKCPYCRHKPQHTYIHCINECEFSLCKQTREEHREILERQGKELPTASINKLAKALTTDNHKDLLFYLMMIESSPYL
jgi:hypothetical protein